MDRQVLWALITLALRPTPAAKTKSVQLFPPIVCVSERLPVPAILGETVCSHVCVCVHVCILFFVTLEQECV